MVIGDSLAASGIGRVCSNAKFSRPLPAEEMTRALREGRRLTLPTILPAAR